MVSVIISLLQSTAMRSGLLALVTAAALTAPSHFPADAEIQAIARKGVPIEGKAGVVIGVLEPDGTTRVVNAADVPYDGRTLFEIGSITKVFTGILLAEMAERGELRLEDPVQNLLPQGIAVPSRDGKQIRLIDLATHSSGLPRMPSNFAPADPRNPYSDYTAERLYDFLRGHQLTRDIGERNEYSNLGVGLLGHALALRAGKSYEELVTERILAPLGMTSTRVVLRPEDRERLAPGHAPAGHAVPNWEFGGPRHSALVGAGGLRSSVEDMLRFVAANLRPPNGTLGRAIRASHVPRTAFSATAKVGLLWGIHTTQFGRTFIWHNGGTAGYRTYVGFDPETRTGVVVLSNRSNGVDRIGMHLLDPRIRVSVADVSRGFHVLPLIVATLLVIGVFASWQRTGATRLRSTLVSVTVLVGLVVWMGGTYVAAQLGHLRFDTRPPTMMLMVALMTALAVGLAVSPVGGRLATGLPLWILVGVQTFRLPLEVLMHRAYEAGLMPVQMSYSGLNFDIVTGGSAVIVAVLVATRRAGARVVRLWNVVGSVLLCNIVVVAVLSMPTPMRVFRTEPANTWIASAPYVWLPAVLVAFAILGHIVVWRAVRQGRNPRTSTTSASP